MVLHYTVEHAYRGAILNLFHTESLTFDVHAEVVDLASNGSCCQVVVKLLVILAVFRPREDAGARVRVGPFDVERLPI